MSSADATFHSMEMRRIIFDSKRQQMMADECFAHHCLSPEEKNVKIESLIECPCGNMSCDICVEELCNNCHECDKTMCFHCSRNNWCFKCHRTDCLLCARISWCKHCNKPVCRDCGYDFCETCMKTVCGDCGEVEWDVNRHMAPYSCCSFCVAIDENDDGYIVTI